MKETIDCMICGKEIEFDVPQEIKFNEQYGDYEAVQVPCPHCKEEGKETLNFLNMSIPASEYEPEEIENEMYFDEREKKNRRAARNIMWQARPDLKKKKRKDHDREKLLQLEKRHGKKIELIKEDNARIKRLELGR